jgi:transcriptional regulator with XRE-family HTH domain
MAFGDRVRQLREQRYLSQAELATRAGISKNTLVRIESGRYGVIPRTVRKLADALEVQPGELISTDELRELQTKTAA